MNVENINEYNDNTFLSLTNELSESFISNPQEPLSQNSKSLSKTISLLKQYLLFEVQDKEKKKWKSYLLIMYSEKIFQVLSLSSAEDRKKISNSINNLFKNPNKDYTEERDAIYSIYGDFIKNPNNISSNLNKIPQFDDSSKSIDNKDSIFHLSQFSEKKDSNDQQKAKHIYNKKKNDSFEENRIQQSNLFSISNNQENKRRQINSSLISNIKGKDNNSNIQQNEEGENIMQSIFTSNLNAQQKKNIKENTNKLKENKDYQDLLSNLKKEKIKEKSFNVGSLKLNLSDDKEINKNAINQKSSSFSNDKPLSSSINNIFNSDKNKNIYINESAQSSKKNSEIKEDYIDNSISHSKKIKRGNRDSDVLSSIQSNISSSQKIRDIDNNSNNFDEDIPINENKKEKESIPKQAKISYNINKDNYLLSSNNYNKKNRSKSKNKDKNNNNNNNNKNNNNNNKSQGKDMHNKKLEKTQNKIDDLIRKINEHNNIINLIKNFRSSSIEEVEKVFQGLKKDNTSLTTKLKILTITCLFYHFFSRNQKSKKMSMIESLFDDEDLNYIYKYFFYVRENHDLLFCFAHQIAIDKQIETNDLFKYSFPYIRGRSELLEKYKLLVFYHSFKSNEYEFNGKINLFFKQLTFFILLFLCNYQYVPFLSEEILRVLNAAKIIKIFYEKGLCNPIEDTLFYDKKLKKFKYGNDLILEEKKNNFNGEIQDLFWDEDYQDYLNIKQMISRLYLINGVQVDNILSMSQNWEFTLGYVELYYFKKNYIYKNPNQYRNNLIKLENEIQNNIKANNLYKWKDKKIVGYSIDEDTSNLFKEIYKYLKEKVNYQFDLYPFGSITQFLSISSSDLDIYLKIHPQYRIIKVKEEILNSILRAVKEIDSNVKSTISQRICVITFEFKHVKIDLSYLGFSPYLHSNLLRTYTLIEPRFSILAICLKKLISLLKIKNSEGSMNFLNSFSWMMLLIVFLQDIIQPPVLPKLLSQARKTMRNVIFGGKKKLPSNQRNFFNFVDNEKKETIEVPLDNYANYEDVYIQMNRQNKKNEMSISELLIKFLEFVGFYFKYDSLYVNFYFKDEGLQNISHIFIDKDVDIEFFDYYKNKYIYLKENYKEEKNERDGMILFREPFDPHYNPGQSLKVESFEIFINKVRDGYKNLVKNGSFKIDNINYDYK